VTAVVGSAVGDQVGKPDETVKIRPVKESGSVNRSKYSAHLCASLQDVCVVRDEVTACRYWHTFRFVTRPGGRKASRVL
jgi:ADP-ribosylglycohydrolase